MVTRRTANRIPGGFTLVEALIVVALLGVIVAFAIPFYQSFQVSSQLDNTTHELVQTLRRAQMQAMASQGGTDYGIALASDRFTLFRGASYSTSDPFNELIVIPPTLSISSGLGNTITFSVVRGAPSSTGSITVQTNNGKTRTITINPRGVIDVL